MPTRIYRQVWVLPTAVIFLFTIAIAACGSPAVEHKAIDVDSGAGSTIKPTSNSLVGNVVGPPNTDWNWQLTGELERNVDAEVWDVDLFEVAPEDIAALQREGRYVICYFSAGSIEDWRPDVGDIDQAAIGQNLDDWPGEKWLDIRAESTLALVESRIVRAKQAGCDAVEPDNVDGYSNKTGFPLRESDQIQFNSAIADKAHARGLAVGLKNSFDIAETLVGKFDFTVTEQCHEYDECELVEPFVELGKPVFNAEYPGSEAAGAALRDEQCAEAARLGIITLFLPIDLDGSWRLSCS